MEVIQIHPQICTLWIQYILNYSEASLPEGSRSSEGSAAVMVVKKQVSIPWGPQVCSGPSQLGEDESVFLIKHQGGMSNLACKCFQCYKQMMNSRSKIIIFQYT